MTEPSHPVVAATLGVAMWSLRGVRARVLKDAKGKVLEIGVGTGLSFRHYDGIESLHGVEPDPHMMKRAQKRAIEVDFPVELHRVGAEDLPFESNSFDTAVVTWVLCTIPEPELALVQVHRALKPGGRLLFAEHTRSKFPMATRMQRGVNPVWKMFAGGCHLTRDSVGLIHRAGFEDVVEMPVGRESWTLTPVYRGTARKPTR